MKRLLVHSRTMLHRRKHCLNFRPERQLVAVVVDIQRLYSDTISYQMQLAFARIINRNRKHTVQSADKFNPVKFIQPQQDFGVGLCPAWVAGKRGFLCEFDEVEYFSVLDSNHRAVIGDKWLMTAFNVDDGKTLVAECHAAAHKDALIVGAAVLDRTSHFG